MTIESRSIVASTETIAPFCSISGSVALQLPAVSLASAGELILERVATCLGPDPAFCEFSLGARPRDGADCAEGDCRLNPHA